MPNNQHKPAGFDGVIQIFVYNWPFYAAALIVDLTGAAALVIFKLPPLDRMLAFLAVSIATFWAASSLLVSHYIYDRSGLYRWEWLTCVLPQGAGSWVNIHAGLDQTTIALVKMFPTEQHTSLDVYVPSQMTEPSIARARRRTQTSAEADTANPAALPLADSAWDTVFVIFAAHELRSHEAKVKLFAEIFRSLRPGGRIVVVEHLRDWKNFLAYGPGFLHFFAAPEWTDTSREAGLEVQDQRWITPFVKCFVFAKPRSHDLSKATEELHNAVKRG